MTIPLRTGGYGGPFVNGLFLVNGSAVGYLFASFCRLICFFNYEGHREVTLDYFSSFKNKCYVQEVSSVDV